MSVTQESVLKTTYNRGEFVKFVGIEVFADGQVGNRMVFGQVECEARAREGWYYVRENESGHVQLVLWSDLMQVDQVTR